MEYLGIDVGGSGIKGAVVDVETGELTTPRFRLPTPEKAKPLDVAQVVQELVNHFEWKKPAGCGFPTRVLHGVCMSAANVHSSWIGTNADELFSQTAGIPVHVVNDADAAGIAEMKFGAGRDYQKKGVVLMFTLGTGIGSAIFTDGVLLPNSEFGHILIREKDAEKRASDATRQKKNLSWEQWAERLQEYFSTLEGLFCPDVIIVGGGVSKESDKFLPYLHLQTKIIPAQLLNQAGIIGAALFCSQQVNG